MSHLENDRDVSAHSEEDACHRARNLCVFSRVQKGTQRLTHKRCVLQHVFLDAISDVTVVLGVRQSIVLSILNIHNHAITLRSRLCHIFPSSMPPRYAARRSAETLPTRQTMSTPVAKRLPVVAPPRTDYRCPRRGRKATNIRVLAALRGKASEALLCQDLGLREVCNSYAFLVQTTGQIVTNFSKITSKLLNFIIVLEISIQNAFQ